MNCYFHPAQPATHTDAVVDLAGTGRNTHEVTYKRVPICSACAIERRAVNTSRVEIIPDNRRIIEAGIGANLPAGFIERHGLIDPSTLEDEEEEN